jgi:phage FluMu protein Com
MSDFEKEYQKIINELEKEIANKKDLEIAKKKLYNIYEYIINKEADNKLNIKNVLENQEQMREDIDKLKKAVLNIEEDIYEDFDESNYHSQFDNFYKTDKMHDNDYEFEITCPYCNYDFIADNSYINKIQIPCPKCKRIIDLDWSSTDECYDNSELDSKVGDTRYSDKDKDLYNIDDDNINEATKENSEQFKYNNDFKDGESEVPKAKRKRDTNKNNGKSQDDKKNENNQNNENNEDDM